MLAFDSKLTTHGDRTEGRPPAATEPGWQERAHPHQGAKRFLAAIPAQ
jgi:hypothetical protein